MDFSSWADAHPVARIKTNTFDRAVRTLLDFERCLDVTGVQYVKHTDYAIAPDSIMSAENEDGHIVYFYDLSLSPTSDAISNIQLVHSSDNVINTEVHCSCDDAVPVPVTPDLIILPACSNSTLWKLRIYVDHARAVSYLTVSYNVMLYKSSVRAELQAMSVRTSTHVYEQGRITPVHKV